MKRGHLRSFRVRHKETDLFIQAQEDISEQVSNWVVEARTSIEAYARRHEGFLESYSPLPEDPLAPPIVKEMLRAGILAGTGPMAAVAGAIAQFICKQAASILSGEIIVENGGDTYFRAFDPITVAIHAAHSPLSGKIGIRPLTSYEFLSICTSSGTVGHSRSFGTADAVSVVSENGALADAVATAVGNMIKEKKDITWAVQRFQEFPGVLAGVIIKGDQIGAWGEIELLPL